MKANDDAHGRMIRISRRQLLDFASASSVFCLVTGNDALSASLQQRDAAAAQPPDPFRAIVEIFRAAADEPLPEPSPVFRPLVDAPTPDRPMPRRGTQRIRARQRPPTDLRWASIAQLAELIEGGKLSPVELVESCLRRIEAATDLGAFARVSGDRALAAARSAEKDIRSRRLRGALHGIPIAHKDNFDTAGVLTTAASKVFEGRIPTEDATAVSRLTEAGAISLGKLSMPELAAGEVGRNPWNRGRSPSGSSSGSGIAVSAGLCYGATGTDTGGSIRLPASACGVVGIKPTYGRVSRFGVIPHAFSLDHAGPLTRTVEDAALMLEAMSGYDPRDPSSAHEAVPAFSTATRPESLRGMRIGFAADYSFSRVAPEIRAAGDNAMKRLAGLGANVQEVQLAHQQLAAPALMILITTELAAAFAEPWKRLGPAAFHPMFIRPGMEAAQSLSAPLLIAAQQARRAVQSAYASALSRVDVFVSAVSFSQAPPAGELPPSPAGSRNLLEDLLWFTGPGNLTGLPVMSLPVGFDSDGMPLAIQLTAKPFAETTLFRVAAALEADFGLTGRHPTL